MLNFLTRKKPPLEENNVIDRVLIELFENMDKVQEACPKGTKSVKIVFDDKSVLNYNFHSPI